MMEPDEKGGKLPWGADLALRTRVPLVLGLCLCSAALPVSAEKVEPLPEGGTGGVAVSPCPRSGAGTRVDSLLTVRITDLTPRFLDFYRAATAEEMGPDDRWGLWRERYGFAAVAPTASGLARARRELEENWEHYPDIMDRVRAAASGIDPDPAPLLERVATLLGLDRPLEVEIILFVGTGRSVAFSMATGDRWQVALPVEQEASRREIAASHEFAHAVHARLAGLEGSWHRSVGHLVLGEGLAMHVARALYPGRGDGSYLGASAEWMEAAEDRHRQILEGVLASIDNATPRAADRFTRGPGPAGMDREAYYAGWVLVDHLLSSGWTLDGLARVPRGLIGRVVEQGLNQLTES